MHARSPVRAGIVRVSSAVQQYLHSPGFAAGAAFARFLVHPARRLEGASVLLVVPEGASVLLAVCGWHAKTSSEIW